MIRRQAGCVRARRDDDEYRAYSEEEQRSAERRIVGGTIDAYLEDGARGGCRV